MEICGRTGADTPHEAFNYRKKTRKAGDRILILEDSSGDGRADKTTVFYQNP